MNKQPRSLLAQCKCVVDERGSERLRVGRHRGRRVEMEHFELVFGQVLAAAHNWELVI